VVIGPPHRIANRRIPPLSSAAADGIARSLFAVAKHPDLEVDDITQRARGRQTMQRPVADVSQIAGCGAPVVRADCGMSPRSS